MKKQRAKQGRSGKTTSTLAVVRAVPRAKHQEGQCTVCSSMDRLKIEREYLDGQSERTLAQTYGLSDSAIRRHAIGTDLNRLRQTDTEIFYLRVIHAAEKNLARGVTARDGLRAAEQLDKFRGVEKSPGKAGARCRVLGPLGRAGRIRNRIS